MGAVGRDLLSAGIEGGGGGGGGPREIVKVGRRACADTDAEDVRFGSSCGSPM